MRGKAFTRNERNKHIARKKNIAEHVYGWAYYGDDGRYNKGKVHCSCGMCSRYRKTTNKGKHRYIAGNYAPSTNWSPNDTVKLNSMDDDLKEWEVYPNEIFEETIPQTSMEGC